MDFSIRKPQLKITPQEDRLYKEGYLKILKNQIPISEGQEYSGYYKNLCQPERNRNSGFIKVVCIFLTMNWEKTNLLCSMDKNHVILEKYWGLDRYGIMMDYMQM